MITTNKTQRHRDNRSNVRRRGRDTINSKSHGRAIKVDARRDGGLPEQPSTRKKNTDCFDTDIVHVAAGHVCSRLLRKKIGGEALEHKVAHDVFADDYEGPCGLIFSTVA